jgi:hypothetical protein
VKVKVCGICGGPADHPRHGAYVHNRLGIRVCVGCHKYRVETVCNVLKWVGRHWDGAALMNELTLVRRVVVFDSISPPRSR